MKKAGIVTMAFRSENYGGVLQAYALARCLKRYGCEGEIIRYDYSSARREQTAFERWRGASPSAKARKLARHFTAFPVKCFTAIGNRLNRKNFSARREAFSKFHRERMPYSERIYSWTTIGDCVPDYDVFIVGSDQVWNRGWINETFLLDFVPPGKPKLSYAASIAQDTLSEEQMRLLSASLKSYRAVSVREEKAAEQLAGLGIEAALALDPTLLLSREEWDELCAGPLVGGRYLFCYFLGTNPLMRRAVLKFAETRRLKVVTFPHILGNYRLCDSRFGDVKLYGVSPAGFLSLIRYAEYVFTDSFHGCLFSLLYQKQFFAFDRTDACSFGMTSRMESLMKIFGTEGRFCDTKEKADGLRLASAPAIDYSQAPEEFLKIKQSSARFLENSLR